MNILNFLRKQDSGNCNSYQAWIPSKSGKLILSVVCGDYLYSQPREFVPVEEYKELEVAIFNAETKDWASYNEASAAFEILGQGEYTKEEYDYSEDEAKTIPMDLNKPQCSVFGYIPVEDINKAWELL